MTEENVKILELEESTLAEIKAQGYVPVSIDGKTFKVPVAQFASLATYSSSTYAPTVHGDVSVNTVRTPTVIQLNVGGVVAGYLVPKIDVPGIQDMKILKIGGPNGIHWEDDVSTSGDHKVSIDEDSVAGFLKDILVSDADEITLMPMNGTLRIGLNLTGESDPKLTTMPESEIDSNTNNYGAYGLQDGFEELEWGDNEFRSYSYCNAKIYQCMRISDAQGSITKCTIALAGSVLDWACLCIGVFDTRGNLLGHTGLRHVGKDFTSGTQLCSFDMRETSQGTLKIKRNTRYIVQVWSVGVQLAAKDRENANYLYDFDLRQNLESTLGNSVDFMDPINGSFNTAAKIPFISFGASDV